MSVGRSNIAEPGSKLRSALRSTCAAKPAAEVSLALNLVVFGIGTLAGASWLVMPAGQTTAQPVGVVQVTSLTLLSMALGWLGLWLLARRWPKLQLWAAWIGLSFGVVTMPVSLIAAADLAAGILLASMHATTGVAWLLAVKNALSAAGNWPASSTHAEEPLPVGAAWGTSGSMKAIEPGGQVATRRGSRAQDGSFRSTVRRPSV